MRYRTEYDRRMVAYFNVSSEKCECIAGSSFVIRAVNPTDFGYGGGGQSRTVLTDAFVRPSTFLLLLLLG